MAIQGGISTKFIQHGDPGLFDEFLQDFDVAAYETPTSKKVRFLRSLKASRECWRGRTWMPAEPRSITKVISGWDKQHRRRFG
jgi:hypothetical protein